MFIHVDCPEGPHIHIPLPNILLFQPKIIKRMLNSIIRENSSSAGRKGIFGGKKWEIVTYDEKDPEAVARESKAQEAADGDNGATEKSTGEAEALRAEGLPQEERKEGTLRQETALENTPLDVEADSDESEGFEAELFGDIGSNLTKEQINRLAKELSRELRSVRKNFGKLELVHVETSDGTKVRIIL